MASGAVILFGWAKPVPVNPRNYRNYRWGELTVSTAGPLSNLVLAVLFSYLLRLGLGNMGLLMPGRLRGQNQHLPGLIQPHSHPSPGRFPYPEHLFCLPNLSRLYAYLEPVGFVLILVLFYTGILSAILMPIYRQIAMIMLG